MEYQEVNDSLEIPKNVGIAGFLEAIKSILKLPRVQNIHIDSRGKVSFTYYLRDGEEKKPLGVDLETVTPDAVIRNGVVEELPEPDLNAAVALGQLFNLAARDHVFPIALVGSPTSTFWRWYSTTTNITPASREEVFGVPFVTERRLEDYVLVLCTGFSRGGALVDTQKSYKLVIPQVTS